MKHQRRPRSIVEIALEFLWLATTSLRAIFLRRIVTPLSNPNCKISRERFLAMMELVFRGEARLRREIYIAALRSLGWQIRVPPAEAFKLPRPGPPRALFRRVTDYMRMLHYPRWFAHRLARRLAKMAREAKDRVRGIANAPPLSADCSSPRRVRASRAAPSRTGRASQPRAPPWRPCMLKIASRPASQLTREVAGVCLSPAVPSSW